jgi:3-phenylpropionate/trans-cinnamate dioxygenase ferredoxin reductase component
MTERYSEYIVIGAGLAGASAIEGIRSVDPKGSVSMIGAENVIPYDRPPLSKKLWSGKKKLEDIYLHKESFYQESGVTLLLGRQATDLNPAEKVVVDHTGERHRYGKLLLATGGVPRTLDIPGGNLDDVFYYRTLNDYKRLRQRASLARSATVLGGGFIGSEIAAALSSNNLSVTMIYPSDYLCDRVFPRDLGLAMEKIYESRNIRILKNQKPITIERDGSALAVHTSAGLRGASDLVIAGVGSRTAVELAEQAGLSTGDGIIVNQYLQTSHPDIYAAGDNARFPYETLDRQMRLEHWDNALNQGKQAGRNMAGAHESFTYMPYFFSDLFEFGYEAVGEVNSKMDIVADWQKTYEKGVLYYTRNGVIRGAMMCNIWDKVEEARELIRRKASSDERLRVPA